MTVGLGDHEFYTRRVHCVQVEEVHYFGRVAEESSRITEETCTVGVKDGRLTIKLSPNGYDSSLAFLHVRKSSSPISTPMVEARLATPPGATRLLPKDPITLEGEVSGKLKDQSVSFYDGSFLLGSDSSSPYSIQISDLAIGTHRIRMQGKDIEGKSFVSPPLKLVVRSPYDQQQGTYCIDFTDLSIDTSVVGYEECDPVPSHYLPDYGRKFGLRDNGLHYGWNRELGLKLRSVHTAPDLRYPTSIGFREWHAFWEMEIPNGRYSVRIAAGTEFKPESKESADLQKNKITVENITVIDSVVTPRENWLENKVDVEVKDGRLTMNLIEGAVCFLEATPIK